MDDNYDIFFVSSFINFFYHIRKSFVLWITTYCMYIILIKSFASKGNIFWNCIAFRNAMILIVVDRINNLLCNHAFLIYRQILTCWKNIFTRQSRQKTLLNRWRIIIFGIWCYRFENSIKLFLKLSIDCFVYAASRLSTNQITLKFSSFISNNLQIIFFDCWIRRLVKQLSRVLFLFRISFQSTIVICFVILSRTKDKNVITILMAFSWRS